ncbi:MAG: formylglycine-generating enzyme family protein [Planctomycetes bacterium]|nr:formylglycine-generating enzyme family protein [Planctomycetota bacterium]
MRTQIVFLFLSVCMVSNLWPDDGKPTLTLPPGFAAVKGTETDPASGLPMRIVCLKDMSEMVLVPAGEFTMGSEKGQKDERPVHKVMLDAFYIDVFEVSNARYRKFMAETDAAPPGSMLDENLCADEQPVLLVSRAAADEFCRWCGKRLPTEAEWEKAARGTDGREYPWGNEPPNANGTFRCNYETAEDGFDYTAPVKSFITGISPYGCYNMAGNVWEWCNDWYDPGYYAESPRSNPQGPPQREYASHRGGSFSNKMEHMRSAYRSGFYHTMPNPVIGFRCALTPMTREIPKKR